MGLDMYAFRVKPEALKDPKALSPVCKDRDEEGQEIAYWRKHHDLHGWMENLYRKKGGTEESFNYVPLQLTREDLEVLEWDVREYKLPPTVGFFFGNNPPNDASVQRDVAFIEAARKALDAGDIVYYNSSW